MSDVLPNALADAEKLSEVVNSNNDTATTRTGKVVRTLEGIDNAAQVVIDTAESRFAEQLANLGLEYPPITYTGGLTVERNTQTYRFNDVIYINTSTDLPFVTNGSFTEDGWQIVQQINQATVIFVADGVKGLENVAQIDRAQVSTPGFYVGTEVGGDEFIYDASRPKSDHDGGTVIDPAAIALWNGTQADLSTLLNYVDSSGDNGCWVRKEKGFVFVEDFGAVGDGTTDNTIAYSGLVSGVGSETQVKFATRSTYIGNFLSPSKSLKIDLNGATLTNATDSDGIVLIGDFNTDSYTIVEPELNHKDTQFSVIGASGLFEVGDIGYLWDGALRPTGGAVNFECVKIKEITGDVITIEGFLASYKGASTITFNHHPSQIKRPEIKNGKIVPTDTHTSFGAACINCESVRMENIETFNTTGNAVAARYCYDVNIKNIRPNKPLNIGSGQGYGVAMVGVSRFNIKNIKGNGNRHVFDMDSAYFGEIDDIEDMDDKSSACTLAHNGFAGYFNCSNVRGKTPQYLVNMAEQGYGGTPNAERGKHPYRNFTIQHVYATVEESVSPNVFGVPGVYIQNSCENYKIRDVKGEYLNADALATGALSALVRINGISGGYADIGNLDCNKVGRIIFSNGNRGTYSPSTSVCKIGNIKAENCDYAVQLQGLWGLSINDVFLDNAPLSGSLILMQDVSGDFPYYCNVGESLDYPSSGVVIFNNDNNTPLKGNMPTLTKTTASVSVSAGTAITQEQIQDRNGLVRLASPIAAGTVTLSATDALPKPVSNGMELYISQATASRQGVEFPAGNNIAVTFTVAPEETVRLIVSSGKWLLVSRSSAV